MNNFQKLVRALKIYTNSVLDGGLRAGIEGRTMIVDGLPDQDTIDWFEMSLYENDTIYMVTAYSDKPDAFCPKLIFNKLVDGDYEVIDFETFINEVEKVDEKLREKLS